MTLVKTNTKHHIKLLTSIALKSDCAHTQVVVQAQQYKVLLQAPFQQWPLHRAIGGVDRVQLGMPTSAYAQ